MVGAAAISGHHLDANQVVSVGSPGMLTNKASNLNPGAPVDASQAKNDIIQYAKGTTLGIGPVGTSDMSSSSYTTFPSSFGAAQFDSDPGPTSFFRLDSVAAHSSYFDHDSTGLLNMGEIIAGEPPTHTAS